MTKKEYLLQYRHINERINRQVEEIARLRELAKKITPTYSDIPKAKNDDSDRLQITVEKILLLEDELNKLTDRYVKLRHDIEQTISSVTDIKLQDLLRYRYIDGLTLEKVAERWTALTNGYVCYMDEH